MKITGFSRVFILPHNKADIVLKVKWDKETMEKLKLVNPTVRVSVKKKDCRLVSSDVQFRIYDNEKPTPYFVHDDDVVKIYQFINKRRENLIKDINERVS
ncbi:hypothetical protein [Priestia aryabhattai]